MSTYLELFSELLYDGLVVLLFLLETRFFCLEKFLVAPLSVLKVFSCVDNIERGLSLANDGFTDTHKSRLLQKRKSVMLQGGSKNGNNLVGGNLH